MNIITLFCEIDDFFLEYETWKSTHCLPEATPIETRGRPRQLHPSEVMTLVIAFHQSNYRTFKHFYLRHVCWVSEPRELFSFRAVETRSLGTFQRLLICESRGL